MAYQIIWSEEAEKTYAEIIGYLHEKWTEKEIERLITATQKVLDTISEFPFSYRASKKKNVREALVTRQNLLFYKMRGNQIKLITFWDTRQNPKNLKI